MKSRFLLLTLLISMTLPAASAPRYIFYFIGDGMGFGQATAAETVNRVAFNNPAPLLMTQFPVAGFLNTCSASSTVTDSAAAGTALATGNKTNNGMLGMTPDSTSVTSIAEILHDDGWGVGLVTNVAPDDATPGAFYAHVPSRAQFHEIGKQAADCGYEFIAGAAWRGTTDSNGNPTGLHEYMRSKEIDLTTSALQVTESKKRRVFLMSDNPFHNGNIGFTIDSIPGALTLPEMTTSCIRHLLRVSPDRFFIMVEGGNIDHVGHGNDGGTVAVEVINFNQAIAEAYEFYKQHPDETVIIVTADHETGGMSLGNNHTGYSSNTHYVPSQKISKDMFSKKIKEMFADGRHPSWDEIKEFSAAATGLWNPMPVSEAQEARIRNRYDSACRRTDGTGGESSLYATYDSLAAEIFRVLNEIQGFGWTSGSHTGNPVPVYAVGKGMEIFGRQLDNTEPAPLLLKMAKGQP